MTGDRGPRRPRAGVAELFGIALVVTDALLLGLALWASYVLRFELELLALERFEKPPAIEYVKAYVLLVASTLTLGRFSDVYRTDRVPSRIEEGWAIFRAVSLSTVLVLALTFFYRGFTYSRLTFAYFWALGTVLLCASHFTFRAWLMRRFWRGIGLRRAVLIGEPSTYLVERLAVDPSFGLSVIGYLGPHVGPDHEPDAPIEAGPLDEDAEEAPATGDASARSGPVGVLLASARGPDAIPGTIAIHRLGALDDLADVLDRERIEEAVILDHGLSHRRLLLAIDLCEERGVRVRLVPPVYDLLVGPSDFTYVQNVPLIRIDERRYQRLALLWKRLFDIAASGFALLLLSPLFAIVAWRIRRSSDGPVFFSQVRAGENGRPFRLYKFRTMVPDAEARLRDVLDVDALKEPVFKLKDDPRITSIGRLLRRTSLDELPQLWNVLRGDMSLVGPRPEELSMVERYDVWQRRRLKVKPGVTGLQQVECRGTPSLNERVRWDIYYIRKRSFLLDLVILFRTVWVVLTGKGAT